MPSEAKLHEIRRRSDYLAIFAELLPSMRGSGDERLAKCIFHDDSNPSLSVNVAEGLYHCFKPDCGAQGDIFSFMMRARGMTFPEAVRELARRAGVALDESAPSRRDTLPPDEAHARNDALLDRYEPAAPARELAPPRFIDDTIPQAHHEQLLATSEKMAWLAEHRGLTRETVERWQLGWDGQRYIIPIRDAEGRCMNIRRYKSGPGVQAHDKMISWRQGFGKTRLWPLTSLEQ